VNDPKRQACAAECPRLADSVAKVANGSPSQTFQDVRTMSAIAGISDNVAHVPPSPAADARAPKRSWRRRSKRRCLQNIRDLNGRTAQPSASSFWPLQGYSETSRARRRRESCAPSAPGVRVPVDRSRRSRECAEAAHFLIRRWEARHVSGYHMAVVAAPATLTSGLARGSTFGD
jgi:hypothetical protein